MVVEVNLYSILDFNKIKIINIHYLDSQIQRFFSYVYLQITHVRGVQLYEFLQIHFRFLFLERQNVPQLNEKSILFLSILMVFSLI